MMSQAHYPPELQGKVAPYRQAIANPTRELPILFHYQISIKVRRQHYNPPIWTDAHYHDFRVTLHLQAVLETTAMYGIDMVEAEQRLRDWAAQLPEVVNNHPTCGGGTTEELCLYFAQIPLDSHIDLLRVDVAEVPERITSLFITAPPSAYLN